MSAYRRREDVQPVSLQGLCPVCQAPAGKPCNAPTERGRRDVNWFHLGRYEAALEALGGDEKHAEKG